MERFGNIRKIGIASFILVSVLLLRPVYAEEQSAVSAILKNNDQKLQQLQTKLDAIQQKQAEILNTVSYLKVRVRKVGR